MPKGLTLVKDLVKKVMQDHNWTEDNVTIKEEIENALKIFSLDIKLVGIENNDITIETPSSVVLQEMMMKKTGLVLFLNKTIKENDYKVNNIKFVMKGRS